MAWLVPGPSLLLLPLAARAQFYIQEGLAQTPQPGGQGVTAEGATLTLEAAANDNWNLCELRFQRELLCRREPSATACSPVSSNLPAGGYNTSRMAGIQFGAVTDLNKCGFRLPKLSSNETGDWNIRMIKFDAGEDDATLELLVGRQAVVELVPGGGTSVVVAVNHSLAVECRAALGRPETRRFQWAITREGSWRRTPGLLQYSARDGFNFRNSSQALLLRPLVPGVSELTCTPEQEGYTLPALSLRIEVVESLPDSSSLESSLHPYTVVLLVLGSLGLLIVLLLLLVSGLTGTLCFARCGRSPRPKGGQGAAREEERAAGKEAPVGLDTSYVVGQDYRPPPPQTRASSSGRGSMVVQEGPPSRPSGLPQERPPSRQSAASLERGLEPTILPRGRGGKVYSDRAGP